MMLGVMTPQPRAGTPQPWLRGLLLSPGEMDGGFLDDEDITSRSLFPESWLWQVEELTEPPNELG